MNKKYTVFATIDGEKPMDITKTVESFNVLEGVDFMQCFDKQLALADLKIEFKIEDIFFIIRSVEGQK